MSFSFVYPRRQFARIIMLHMPVLMAGVWLQAAPLPDDDALAKLLGSKSRITFLAGFGTVLETLEADAYPTLQEKLSASLKTDPAMRANVEEALRLLEDTWASKFPVALLNAACADRKAASLDGQAKALQGLLKKDLELAIAYYLKLPLYGSFSHQCDFYQKLSDIDPARAYRLYFESRDKDRAFDNPLLTAVEAWVERDLDAGWAAISSIEDEDKRRDIRLNLICPIAIKEPERYQKLLNAITDEEERKILIMWVGLINKPRTETPTPPVKDEATIARETEELERILRAGYAAYDSSKSDQDGRRIAQMYAQFPERSWIWLQDMSLNDSYANNRYRDLANVWPADKLAEATPRMLDGGAKQRTFGIQLAYMWMQHDPETALPFLFSKYPRLAGEWLKIMPFYAMDHTRKWDNARILALLDKISDPDVRDRAKRKLTLYRISRTPTTSLPILLALEHSEDVRSVLSSYVRGGVRSENPRRFIESVLAIAPEHHVIRDQVLAYLPAEILECHDPEIDAIPKVIAAIQDPATKIRAIESIPDYRTPQMLKQRYLDILQTLPAGSLRDIRMAGTIRDSPVAERLALLSSTDDPMLLSAVLTSIPTEGLDETQFAACLAALEKLPPAWKNQQLDDRWLIAAASHDTEKWGEILRKHLLTRGADSLIHMTLNAWIKRDPSATLRAILSTGPMPEAGGWVLPVLLKIHADDHAAIFRRLRAEPILPERVLPELFAAWSRTDPAAAAANCLLVEPSPLRLQILGKCAITWLSTAPEAVLAWAESLPPSPERSGTVLLLAMHLRQTKAALPDWIKAELPPDSPYRKEPGEKEDPRPQPNNESNRTSPEKQKAADDRQRTAATVRALALLDEETTVAQIRALPAGAHKADSLLGLLIHATASNRAALREEVLRDLKDSPFIKPGEVAITVIKNLPLEKLDEALAFWRGLTDADVRAACGSEIVLRWTGEKYAPRVIEWLRSLPDNPQRTALMNTYLRTYLGHAPDSAAGKFPELAEMENFLRDILTAAARAELAQAVLEKRAPAPRTLENAMLGAEANAAMQGLLEKQEAERRKTLTPEP